MGKVKKKNHDEVRYLKGAIRELEKEVRTLRKELHYYKKRPEVDIDEKEDDIPEATPKKLECTDCGKGTLEVFEILDKVFTTCNLCGERKKVK